MTEQEQIEEMAVHCCYPCDMECNGECLAGEKPKECYTALVTAKELYEAGYRKQVVGEWIFAGYSLRGERAYKCSLFDYTVANLDEVGMKFCPNCGAHMKGGNDNGTE